MRDRRPSANVAPCAIWIISDVLLAGAGRPPAAGLSAPGSWSPAGDHRSRLERPSPAGGVSRALTARGEPPGSDQLGLGCGWLGAPGRPRGQNKGYRERPVRRDEFPVELRGLNRLS